MGWGCFNNKDKGWEGGEIAMNPPMVVRGDARVRCGDRKRIATWQGRRGGGGGEGERVAAEGVRVAALGVGGAWLEVLELVE